MGEAKRRKLLDPYYGKEKYYSFFCNKGELKIRAKVLSGILDYSGGDDYNFWASISDDEMLLIEELLDENLEMFLEHYSYQKTQYQVIVDASKLLSENKALLVIFPMHLKSFFLSGNNPTLVCEMILTTVYEGDSDKIKVTHQSPVTHVRKAHQRRVCCGKGRLDRKWVDIKETVVNKK